LQQVLLDHAQLKPYAINEFMRNFFPELRQSSKKIQELFSLILPENNPQVWLWIVHAQLENFLLTIEKEF
jgi:hypothetical protein